LLGGCTCEMVVTLEPHAALMPATVPYFASAHCWKLVMASGE